MAVANIVNSSIRVATSVISTSIATTGASIATCALLIPIGAANSAIFGLSFGVGYKCTELILKKIFYLNDPDLPEKYKVVPRIITVVASVFAGIGMAMLALSWIGFPLPFITCLLIADLSYLMSPFYIITLKISCEALIAIGNGFARINNAITARINSGFDAADAHANQAREQAALGRPQPAA